MFRNKTILVTGGTGSFGKEFSGELLKNYEFKKIIIFSRDEFKQDLMRKEFATKFSDSKIKKLRFFIGDVRDKERIKRAFSGVDIVVHAAAMKQVPACEYNPSEAIKTNIEGAINVIDAALDRGVKKVIALSTDKAVNPINLYGGTKFVSDKLFVAANSYSGIGETVFAVVRYGNVSGSRGSVIPYFKSLIESGAAEFPITSEKMTRFWMTLDKAVNLVVLAIREAKGGETFIYKNPSYKVVDLATAMDENRKQKIVGIREGEKIHEMMVTRDDSRFTYDYGDYFIIYPNFEWSNFEKLFKKGGKKVEDGFKYYSGKNDDFLSVGQIRKLLEEYGLV